MPIPAYARSSRALGRLAPSVTGRLRPAGQSSPALTQDQLDAALGVQSSYTFSPQEAGLSTSATPTYGQGATYTYDASGNPVLRGLTQQQAGQILSTIGSAASATGSSIAAMIRSADAVSRQALESATVTEIQRLQTQLAGAQAAGNTAAAQRTANSIAALQQALAQTQSQSSANLANYAWGAGALLVALGVGAFVVLRKPKKRSSRVRKNPSRRRRARSNPACGCMHRRGV